MKTGKIIVALDFSDVSNAVSFVKQLSPNSCALKVGKELFLCGGPRLVESLANRGFRVFLDLKFHDIPNTVSKACINASRMGVWMLNVHAMGGLEMLKAARDAIPKDRPDSPLLLAVTILTSLDDADLEEIGFEKKIPYMVKKLSSFAKASGFDGVVCSAREAGQIAHDYGNSFIRVTPGIRLHGDSIDEQKRVMTPNAAVQNGASYLVIGRSITQSRNPMAIIDKINSDLLSVDDY